jgi:hypothetical protein
MAVASGTAHSATRIAEALVDRPLTDAQVAKLLALVRARLAG